MELKTYGEMPSRQAIKAPNHLHKTFLTQDEREPKYKA